MFLRQLTYLLALDRFHHFSRAAEACGVSQPALSAGIRQLEAELGITIIQRNRRFFGLTAEGERVLAWARQTLAALDGLRQEAALAQDMAGGSLVIGVIPAASQVVPVLLERFRAVVPALHVEVKICSSRDIVHLLREHTLQLGLMYLDQVPADSPFETHTLYVEEHVLAAAKSMPLPAAKTIKWKDISTVPLCLFTTEMRSRQLVDAGFREAGVTPIILLETNALELLHAELLSGRLASILPVTALPERIGPEGLQIRHIGPSVSPEVGLVKLDHSNGSAVLERIWGVVHSLKLDDVYTF